MAKTKKAKYGQFNTGLNECEFTLNESCELMRIDPSIEFASRPDNLSIGTSEENRHQGGYTFEFTDKNY